MTKQNWLLACALFFLVSPASLGLQLNAKKFSLGGRAAITSKIELDSNYLLEVDLKPSGSILFPGRWELGVSPYINLEFFRSVPEAHKFAWGANVFFRRYFPLNDLLHLYGGSSVGGRIFDLTAKTFKGTLGAEVGVLISLSNNIGIDLGLPIILHFDTMSGFRRIDIPIGYFGLKAFF